MRPFALRLLAYLLLIALVFELEALAMGWYGWEEVLREDGLIEWGEVIVLGVAGVLAMGLVFRAPRMRGLYALLAVGLWLIVFREFDNSVAYHALSSREKVAGVIVLVGGLAFLDRRNLFGSVYEILGRPQGVLLALGTMLVFVWAQLLGQPALWAPLYQDYGRGRRVVEESLELAGHMLILFAVIEEHVHLGRLRRPAGALLVALLLVLAGCGGNPEQAEVRTEIQDQTAHHGGVVTMAGFLHVEAAATRDGTVRLWLTDEDRNPVSLEGSWGHVQLDLPDAPKIPLVARDGALVAAGAPFTGDEVRTHVELLRDGRSVLLYFVLPLDPARPGVAGVPAAGCAPVTPTPGASRSPRCAVVFTHGVLALATTSDGSLALVSEAEGNVSAWRMPAGEVALTLAPPPPAEVRVEEGAEPDVGASAIAIRPDGREAVIAFGPRLVRYQVDDGRVARELPQQPARVRDVAWTPAGPARVLVSLYGTPDARLLDAETGQVVRTVAVAPETAAVAFRADGREGAVGGELGPVVLFDPGNDAPARPLADVLQPVEDLGFAGDRVVWAGADRTMRVWGADGAVLSTQLPEAAVRVAVSPRQGIVAIALRSGTIELRRVDDGSLVETLRWHTSGVRSLAWAGSVLLTGDTDGSLALWDLGSVPGML